MIERLGFVENQYEELTMRISDPSVIADTENWQKLVKEHSDLQHIVEEYREYKRVKEELDDNLEMLESENDQEMREMFNDDIRKLRPEMEQVVTKRHFLPIVYLECILSMQRIKTGA